MGKSNHHKEKGIKIIDPRKTDYTYTGKDDLFTITSPSYSGKENNDLSNRSRIEKKNIDLLRHDITKDTKIKTKGRMTGGQSKQSHSSVYE
jgi:hypothetical protein